MLNRAVNGYTVAQVDRALQGLDLPFQSQIRAELLDLDNTKLFDLDGLQLEGSITHNTDQPIKRGAELHFKTTVRDSQHSNALGTFASLITAQNRLFHYRLNDTASPAADFTGNGRTSNYLGPVTFSHESLVAGDQTNNAVKFNGIDSYIVIADAAWMNVSNIELVLSWRGTGVNQTLIDRDDGTTTFWRLDLDANGILQFKINFTTGAPTTKTFSSGIAINDGIAHLIHASYDGARVQIFIDGKRVVNTVETRAMKTTGSRAIGIAVNGAGANFSSGVFDEVGMIGRVLTPAERRDEYQAWSNQTNELLLDKDRSDRVKIWYGIKMSSPGTDGTEYAEWPQIVAVMTTPKQNYSQTGILIPITCQDQTRILADDKFTVRTTLASGANYITGTNGVIAIAQSSGFDTSAWAVTSTTLTAPADVDFEIGSSKLEAINYLLLAINYRPIRFAGDGSAIIEANVLDKDRPTVDTLASGTTSVVSADELSVEIEQRRVINQVTVFNGNPDATPIIATATNNKGRSPTSTVFVATKNKKLQIDVADQTTATALANQELSDETMRWARRVRMKTIPRPIHDDRDRVRLTISELGIDSDYVEDEWVLPLNPLELMSHNFLSVIDVTT